MKMMCKKHGEYHYIEDFRCPKCVDENAIHPKQMRERIYNAFMLALPPIDNDEFWNNRKKVAATVADVMKRESQRLHEEDSPFSLTFEHHQDTGDVDIYLIPRMVKLNISISVEDANGDDQKDT